MKINYRKASWINAGILFITLIISELVDYKPYTIVDYSILGLLIITVFLGIVFEILIRRNNK